MYDTPVASRMSASSSWFCMTPPESTIVSAAAASADATHAAAIAPAMAERGGGAIINLGSWIARLGIPIGSLYSSTKGAIETLTRAWAAEFGPAGVRVNAIGPGLIETNINAEARAKNPDMVANVMRHTPLNRAGKPEDIAGPAVFLASDLSSYVTGSIIIADGGFQADFDMIRAHISPAPEKLLARNGGTASAGVPR